MPRLRPLALVLFLLSVLSSRGQQRNVPRPSPTPFVLGVVDSLPSAILHETRRINIAFPVGYSPDSARKYPVIYLLDGGADEDFVHLTGLVRYNTTPWINRFPPSIVVGLENVNRRRDFTFAVADLNFLDSVGFDRKLFPAHGGSARFMAFLEQELQPFIARHYRAQPAGTLIGESLAGLLATEILLKKPTLFDTYIILSPSLWWGNESLLKQVPALLQAHPLPPRVYVGASDQSEDRRMYNEARALAETLQRHNPHRQQVIFEYLPDETHATIGHQGVYNAFKKLYPLKK